MDTGLRRYDDVGVLTTPLCHHHAYARDDKGKSVSVGIIKIIPPLTLITLTKKTCHSCVGRNRAFKFFTLCCTTFGFWLVSLALYSPTPAYAGVTRE